MNEYEYEYEKNEYEKNENEKNEYEYEYECVYAGLDIYVVPYMYESIYV